jgi:parvulin-like peptidyl-prolyl isomerase
MSKFKTVFLAGLLSMSLYAADYAVVNGDTITDDDINMIIRNPQIDFNSLPDATKRQVIDQAIEKRLLTANANKSDITSSKDYQEALEKVKQDLALEFWMQKEFKAINIKHSAVKKFYEDNSSKFQQPESVKARHILVKTEDEAKALIKELEASKDTLSKFIELAKTKSTGPSGPNGGDLGWFDAKRMVPEFSAASFKLDKNSFTKSPVKTQFGYHVIYVEDKKPSSTVPLADVKSQIENQLKSEKFKEIVSELAKDLRKKAKVEYK